MRIAHRAGNGRAALHTAITEEIDWIELDLWYTFGRLVARHERGFGRIPLVYDRWSVRYLSGGVIELDEIIRLTEGGPRLLIDLKGAHPRLPGAIVETLRREGAIDRAAVCGQLWPPLDAIRSAEPRIKVFHSLGRPEHVRAYASRLRSSEPLDGVSIAKWLVTPELVETYARREIKLIAWTVNERDFASQLVDWGVHGIISDRLDLLSLLP
ncbi:MAG: glycerophosphodiester phosphodiesterase [Dehalococcoidia bacterium]